MFLRALIDESWQIFRNFGPRIPDNNDEGQNSLLKNREFTIGNRPGWTRIDLLNLIYA